MQVHSISNTQFQMAPGNYINPLATEQKALLKTALKDSFEHDNNITHATNTAIKKVFPNMNFILTSIDSIRNNQVIQKLQPLIKILTSYWKGELQTFFFVNGQKMVDILNDDKDEDIYGGAKAKQMFEKIAENVVLANEPYFIAEVVKDFTERLFLQDTVTPETVNNATRESLVKFDIDIDNKVLSNQNTNGKNNRNINQESNLVRIHYSPKNVQTTMYVNDKTSENVRYAAIPQNFANVLCANSKMFNKINMDTKKEPHGLEVIVDWGSIFVQLSQMDHDFLQRPISVKQDIYVSIVQNILAASPMESRESIFKQLLTQTAQETLAYTLAPNILEMMGNKRYLPMGEYFRDLHAFLNVVNFTDYMI